ncbi:hypothetical protein [Rhodococcus jostii]|uniref:hypothetical protein n=1 Tax=Rhodococcus jostii TaxID=132919 RepID=UPI003634C207
MTDTTAVDDTTTDTVPDPSPGTRSLRDRLKRRPSAVVLLGVVALFAVLGWGSFTLWQNQQTDRARTSALDAGRQYATDLATYSYQDLDTNLSLVKSNSVGEFAGQYSQVASNLRDMIVQYQATSSAQIVQAGLASGDQDAAEVLVFLDQTVTNSNSPDPRVDRNRMQLSLVHEGGGWKLANVQLL